MTPENWICLGVYIGIAISWLMDKAVKWANKAQFAGNAKPLAVEKKRRRG